MADTTTIRVSTEIQSEISRIAALRGVSSGELLGEAWREFLATHRSDLAEDLEQAAQILRGGTTQDLADFLSRDVPERAKRAAEAARS
jgi:predicted transcriptional regulator